MSFDKAKERLEILTNILVLVIGIALISFFVYKNFYHPVKSMESETLKKGTVFHGLEEVDFSSHPNTLILALSTKCPYCTRSNPFYKRLLACPDGDCKGCFNSSNGTGCGTCSNG